jgi:hypothetical protein
LEWVAPSSGTPAFVGASLYKSGFQNISQNTFTAVTWNSELFDTDAFHDTSTNTSRITIPAGKDGKYLITGVVAWSSGTFDKEIYLYKGGSSQFTLSRIAPTTSSVYTAVFSSIISLAATNYIEIFVNTSGSGVSIDGGTDRTLWQLQYLGA